MRKARTKGQIQEYLDLYRGEGIQHIAMATDDIYGTVEALRQNGVVFLDTPETYYELLDRRLPNHGEDVSRLQKNRILLDGAPGGGLLLQIFTENQIGPIFFEIIQRKGQRRLRRRQLQGPVRIDRTGPDAPRRTENGGISTRSSLSAPPPLGR